MKAAVEAGTAFIALERAAFGFTRSSATVAKA
jgi:hypothetical protein